MLKKKKINFRKEKQMIMRKNPQQEQLFIIVLGSQISLTIKYQSNIIKISPKIKGKIYPIIQGIKSKYQGQEKVREKEDIAHQIKI